MSEYQYYEFQAVDKPLSQREMAELRAVSTRAQITPNRFRNTYDFGSFKGDPKKLMERYFDGFVYTANWGTREFMLRLPNGTLDLKTVSPYCGERNVWAKVKDGFMILGFFADGEDRDWEGWMESEDWLPALLPLRRDLAGGDRCCLYLGWLLSAQSGELEDDEREPAVPSGLKDLSEPLKAFSEFLGIDLPLIEVAAEKSPMTASTAAIQSQLGDWIRALPQKKKDDFLMEAAQGNALRLQADILREFRRDIPEQAVVPFRSRTVSELLAEAARLKQQREQEAARRAAEKRALREREERLEREKYLDDLSMREEETWRQAEQFIGTTRPQDYDQAVGLLVDLRDMTNRKCRFAEFQKRFQKLHETHSKKPSLLRRMGRAGLLNGGQKGVAANA